MDSWHGLYTVFSVTLADVTVTPCKYGVWECGSLRGSNVAASLKLLCVVVPRAEVGGLRGSNVAVSLKLPPLHVPCHPHSHLRGSNVAASLKLVILPVPPFPEACLCGSTVAVILKLLVERDLGSATSPPRYLNRGGDCPTFPRAGARLGRSLGPTERFEATGTSRLQVSSRFRRLSRRRRSPRGQRTLSRRNRHRQGLPRRRVRRPCSPRCRGNRCRRSLSCRACSA